MRFEATLICQQSRIVAFLRVGVFLCVCVHTTKAEATLHQGELSHVNGTELQAILSLFVLLPPQGPPLAQLASTCACLVR